MKANETVITIHTTTSAKVRKHYVQSQRPPRIKHRQNGNTPPQDDQGSHLNRGHKIMNAMPPNQRQRTAKLNNGTNMKNGDRNATHQPNEREPELIPDRQSITTPRKQPHTSPKTKRKMETPSHRQEIKANEPRTQPNTQIRNGNHAPETENDAFNAKLNRKGNGIPGSMNLVRHHPPTSSLGRKRDLIKSGKRRQ
jgi:hypothetical protein